MRSRLLQVLQAFLAEDEGWGDLTTLSLIPEGLEVVGRVKAGEPGVFCGLLEARGFAQLLGLGLTPLVEEGQWFQAGNFLLELKGSAQRILGVERVLLNLLSHMCGVATTTRRLVDRVREVNPRVRVAATRKTLPGLRWFEKRAVKVGGGDTHRYDLSSLILIKDNHLALLGDLAHTIKLARERTSFALKIEVEVTAPEEAVIAAGAGADIVMLDNMTPTEVKAALEALERAGLRQRVIVEASGGIDAANILDYVRAGVDVVSIGALTDSAKAIDLSLEVEKV